MHVESDWGDLENVFKLSTDQLAKRKVVKIDIANDLIPPKDYKEEFDPSKERSGRTWRGTLQWDWKGGNVQIHHVCLQAGGVRIQMVGTADQSGEHDYEGEYDPIVRCANWKCI